VTDTAWNDFWTMLPAEAGAALWDSSSELNAARHLPLFRNHLDPLLPLVDVGCGSGRQTQWLAQHFGRVIGLDIAEAAVALADRTYPAPNVTYRCADLLDQHAAAALHAELGDANIYMRCVLHQLVPAKRTTMLKSIELLLGRTGHIFTQELTRRTGWYVKELLEAGEPLPKAAELAARFDFGARYAPAQDGELRQLLEGCGFVVVADGDIPLRTTENDSGGRPLELPTSYVVARRAPSPTEKVASP
jgi:SAM-dependent methyltransferase